MVVFSQEIKDFLEVYLENALDYSKCFFPRSVDVSFIAPDAAYGQLSDNQ